MRQKQALQLHQRSSKLCVAACLLIGNRSGSSSSANCVVIKVWSTTPVVEDLGHASKTPAFSFDDHGTCDLSRQSCCICSLPVLLHVLQTGTNGNAAASMHLLRPDQQPQQQQGTAEEERQQAKGEEGEQRQAKAAAKKAKKQRQKAKRQQAQGLTPPTSEPDISAPQSPSAQSPGVQNEDAGHPESSRSAAQSSDSQAARTEAARASSPGPQSQQLKAHETPSRQDAGQGSSNTDADMLQLFRCPITKVRPQPLLDKLS